LESIAKIEAVRSDKKTGQATTETRYYICSISDAKRINHAVRKHWGIENSLHWVLDVRFNDDNEMKRKNASPYNFSFITKTIFNLIKLDDSKGSIKTKRMKAVWGAKFREQILQI
jgi:predicted transposase YbfD/YdcC